MIFQKRCIGVPGCQKNGFESLWSGPEGVYEHYTFFIKSVFFFPILIASPGFPRVPRGSPGIPGTPGRGPGDP